MRWNSMIAIISDAHGNYPALKAVLSEIDKLNCGRIISLGDVSGYYCMVNECIDEFRRRNIVNLMGNHDYYVLGRVDCPRSYTVNKITGKLTITFLNCFFSNFSLRHQTRIRSILRITATTATIKATRVRPPTMAFCTASLQPAVAIGRR